MEHSTPLPFDLGKLLETAASAQADPRRFFVYRGRPLEFFEEVLGVPVWSPENPDVPGLVPKQVELVEAIEGPHRRIAVRSCHGYGKTFVLAGIVLYWLYTRESKVITTASTWRQVEGVLWNEIRRMWRRAVVPLPALPLHPLKTELAVVEEWLAIGVSTNNPTALQGHHHPEALVVVDEAPGLDVESMRALRSLVTGERNKFLMVGNPTVVTGPFWEAFKRGGWHRLHFDGMTHPNIVLGREVIPGAITKEFIEDELGEWGSEDHPLYLVRVRGEFPTASQFGLFPVDAVDKAMDRDRYEKAVAACEQVPVDLLAVDVARAGENSSVIGQRKGWVLTGLSGLYTPNTMDLVGRIVALVNETKVPAVVVDEPGMGGPIIDRLLEVGVPVFPFNTQRSALAITRYASRRSELAWNLRVAMLEGKVYLPPDEELREQLLSLQFRYTSDGRIRVLTKEEMKAQGIKSPDKADVVIMAFTDGVAEVSAGLRESEEPRIFRLDQDTTLLVGEVEAPSVGGLSEWF